MRGKGKEEFGGARIPPAGTARIITCAHASTDVHMPLESKTRVVCLATQQESLLSFTRHP